MLLELAHRVVRTTEPRLLWKFAWNFGFKGMLSVQRFKSRLRRGIYFPPFLYVSIINSCNLRCQGCWVDVASPRQMISYELMCRLIADSRKHGNSFFGILGGEPFMHPDLLRVLDAHRDCYFQVFTNGHFITERVAAELRRIGNVTPLVSIEGTQFVSDQRRGRNHVFDHTLTGLRHCLKHKLITGVATSLCQTNLDELLSENWIRQLIDLGVHYVWYYTYRPVGPKPTPELALRPEQLVRVRQFLVQMRKKLPIGIIDAYWDDKGQALCPMSTGISHHIGPSGGVEPCPIIQFAAENINHDGQGLDQLLINSRFLADFRRASAAATRGCVVLERPDLVKQLVLKHGAADTTARQTALAELDAMVPRTSQHQPQRQIPEEHWAYRFAKKHWFFGFGAYG